MQADRQTGTLDQSAAAAMDEAFVYPHYLSYYLQKESLRQLTNF